MSVTHRQRRQHDGLRESTSNPMATVCRKRPREEAVAGGTEYSILTKMDQLPDWKTDFDTGTHAPPSPSLPQLAPWPALRAVESTEFDQQDSSRMLQLPNIPAGEYVLLDDVVLAVAVAAPYHSAEEAEHMAGRIWSKLGGQMNLQRYLGAHNFKCEVTGEAFKLLAQVKHSLLASECIRKCKLTFRMHSNTL